jgi:hypothetical protein
MEPDLKFEAHLGWLLALLQILARVEVTESDKYLNLLQYVINYNCVKPYGTCSGVKVIHFFTASVSPSE